MNNYTYQPLLHDDAIRILTLMPGFKNLRIEGTMSSMRLSSIPASTIQAPGDVWAFNFGQFRGRPEDYFNSTRVLRVGVSLAFRSSRISYTTTSYDALSYVWGNPEKVEEIIVDGNRLGVARNLHTGLLRLRHPTERRRLWIDALCINQTDNHERNHQVGFMQRIYTYASSVIVWLGDPKPDVGLTLDMILNHNHNDKFLNYNLNDKSRSGNLFLYDPAALRGLKQLFENSWWGRIWVVQEAVAARELVVVLGRTIFPWNYLSVICAQIHEQSSSDHHLAPALQSCGYRRFRDLADLKAAWKMPLEHLLRITQHYQATDPRDKIYALLGMALDMSINPLVPDYNKSVQEVFQDLIRLMARRRTLNLICLGNWFGRDQVQLWLPSPQTVALILLPYGGGGAHLHRAAGDTQAAVDMSEFPRSLTAQGVIADTVEMLGDPVTIAQECASTVQRWQDPSAQKHKGSYTGFMKLIAAPEDSPTLQIFPQSNIQRAIRARSRQAQDVANSLTRTDMERSFFTTKGGRIGLAPAGVQVDDQVVILKGCHVPLIIRATKSHGIIVGEAYVLGMMYGEVMEGLRNGQYKSRMLRLR